MSGCKHPKDARELLHGYDVTCGECGDIIGRVALFPCAVLTASEAAALLVGEGGKAERGARAKLQLAARPHVQAGAEAPVQLTIGEGR